jgi:hypothetical protein
MHLLLYFSIALVVELPRLLDHHGEGEMILMVKGARGEMVHVKRIRCIKSNFPAVKQNNTGLLSALC